MFPSHLSVNDLGVFAVAMVFALIVVLLFTFDFVSNVQSCIASCSEDGVRLSSIHDHRPVTRAELI